MEFGMLSRNGRGVPIAAASWNEDLWDMVTADELGFQEVWITEHVHGSGPDHLPAADLFICRAAGVTKQIRFGPGIRPIPNYHPIMVAMEAAVTDHLTGGRYIAGFGGAGTMGNYFRQFGVDRQATDKRAMMHEGIDFILKCWAEDEPFDFHGQFWHGEGIHVQPKPLQQPLPVGLAVSETISTAELAGRKGFLPLHSQFEGPAQLRELASAFEGAAEAAGREAPRKGIRIARFVHVSDTDKAAREEIRQPLEPWVQYIRSAPISTRHLRPRLAPGMELADVTFDYLVDSGVYFVGSPETVIGRIRELYDEVDGFGVLLLEVGRGNGSRELRERCWSMVMKDVAPQLADLDGNRRGLGAAAV